MELHLTKNAGAGGRWDREDDGRKNNELLVHMANSDLGENNAPLIHNHVAKSERERRWAIHSHGQFEVQRCDDFSLSSHQ